MTDIPSIDDLPELPESMAQRLKETELSWEVAFPTNETPCDLWRVVHRRTLGRHTCRFSEWFSSEDRANESLEYIKSAGHELVSVTKYRQVTK